MEFMRILLLSTNVPFPPNSGFRLRLYNILYRIAKKHEVWLLSFVPEYEKLTELDHLVSICKEVAVVPLANQGALANPWKAIRYFLKGIPPDLRMYDSKEFADRILALISRINFDIVQFEDSHMGIYLDYLPKSLRSRAILTFHDVNYHKHERLSLVEPKRARRLRLWLHGRQMRRWEPRQAQRFGHCITMSHSDETLLLNVNPSLKITVLPNGVDTQSYQPLPYPAITVRLLYVGTMGYRPNIDAVTYFCRTIYPKIKQEYPNIEFWIVGRDPGPEVTGLEGGGVHVTGQVEDLLPYYRDSVICVVPLRAGGGTRLKILEAMALGRPIVSTTVGCEGLAVKNGEHLFVADTPELFARHVLTLLKDKQKWLQITRQARALAVNSYDWDMIAQRHMQLYEETICQNRG